MAGLSHIGISAQGKLPHAPPRPHHRQPLPVRRAPLHSRDGRIRVGDVLELLGAGVGVDEILGDYPDLEREDVYAALVWVARYVDHPRQSR